MSSPIIGIRRSTVGRIAQAAPGVDWAARQALDNGDQFTAHRAIPDLPRGMVGLGNINLDARPVVQNSDGSHSTEYSTSFGDEHGREILAPTVVRGQFLTPTGQKPPEGSPEEKEMFRRAQRHYESTGEQMGIFSNPDDADAYAQAAHNRGIATGSRQRYVVIP